MRIESIENKGRRFGYVVRGHLDEQGRKFPGPNEDFMQVGYLNLKKSEWVTPHRHKECARSISKTQKVVYVVSGKVRLHFYEDRKKVREIELEPGDLAVLISGGFGFESLADKTKIIEIKQGPYLDVEHDKEKFEPIE